MKPIAKNYYAVRVGKNTGIFNSWENCKKEVIGISGAEFKGFDSLDMAEKYLTLNSEVKIKIGEEYIKREDFAIKLSKEKETVCMYCDGSWGKDKTDDSKMYAGGYLIIDNNSIIEKRAVHGNHKGMADLRNIAGEMLAVIKGLEYIKEKLKTIKVIHVFVDYTGLIYWTMDPDMGGWKTKNPYTKEYSDIIKKLRLDNNLEINFHHVKGHIEDKFNEEVDTLATYGKYMYTNGKEFNLDEFEANYSFIDKK